MKSNVLPQQMRKIPMALSPKLGTATPKAVKLSGLAAVPQRPTSRWHCSPSCGVQKVPENREKWNSVHPWTNSQLLTEGNRGLSTLIDPYIEKKKKHHTPTARWTVVNDQQGKLFLISSLLAKSDTKETHFREDHWRRLQLALAQVTSPECLLGNASVVNPVPATYSMCWLLVTLPASLHSQQCGPLRKTRNISHGLRARSTQ